LLGEGAQQASIVAYGAASILVDGVARTAKGGLALPLHSTGGIGNTLPLQRLLDGIAATRHAHTDEATIVGDTCIVQAVSISSGERLLREMGDVILCA
jgi:hypothetical protein